MSAENIEEIEDEQTLRQLLDESEDYDFRRRIRARMRLLKKETSPAETEKPRVQDAQFVKIQRNVAPSTKTSKATETGRDNGHREFVEKSSHLRTVTTDTKRPASTCGVQMETVSLRSAPRPLDTNKAGTSLSTMETVQLRSSPRIVEPRKTDSCGATMESVVLRKVIREQKTEEAPRLRANAKVTPKAALEKFKELDLNSDAGRRFLEACENGSAKRRSPTPNSIRDQMLDWCRARVSCYDDIVLDDFSSSWNDGMAFCALVHSFYPEAFDYDTLDRKNKRHNFQLAFDTAENLAGVVPLLDVEDMVEVSNPDWKCVFTYVNCFANRMSEIRKEKKKNAELQELERQQREKEREEELLKENGTD